MMMLNDKESFLNDACDEALSVIYDYFQVSESNKSNEYTNEIMNKMTNAVKATIRFNNTLLKALNENVIKLSPQASNMLNMFYSFYDQMPHTEEQVSETGGTALMDIYTGMIQSMTPIALLVSSEMSARKE